MTPKRIALVLVFAVATLISGVRLFWMGQVRGWIPGATVEQATVTQKWHQTPDEQANHINVYWIAWGETPIAQAGNHRADLSYDRWASLDIGSPIVVSHLGRDPRPYVRDGIFDSEGNFFAVGGGFLVALALAAKFLLDLRKAKEGGEEPKELHLFPPQAGRPV